MALSIRGRGPRGYGRGTRAFSDRRHAWVRDRLVAAWLCDEGAGTVLRELSGRGGQGALSSGATWGQSDWGSALVLSGVAPNSRVIVPRATNPRFLSAWQRLTVMALIRPAPFASRLQRLVHFGGNTPIGSSTGPWSFYLDDLTIASGLAFRVNDATAVNDTKIANCITPNVWQLVGFTVRRSLTSNTAFVYTGYVNGQRVGFASWSRQASHAITADPAIGASSDGSAAYEGRIAGVWLWDYGMDAGQVAQFSADPFGAWRLDPTPFVAPGAGGGGGIGGGGVPAILRRRHGGL